MYQTLDVNDYDDDGLPVEDRIHARDQFHGSRRYDYAVLKDKGHGRYYGQVHCLFIAQYKNRILSLCLCRNFITLKEEHITGMRVLVPAFQYNYRGLFITHIEDIEQSVHIVPDFASGRTSSGFYRRYLLNHDVDRYTWSTIDPWIPQLKQITEWKALENAAIDQDVDDQDETDGFEDIESGPSDIEDETEDPLSSE